MTVTGKSPMVDKGPSSVLEPVPSKETGSSQGSSLTSTLVGRRLEGMVTLGSRSFYVTG